MGNAQVPRVAEPRALLAENPSYQGLAYQDVLGSYKLFKVMRCVHESEGDVVVKLFIHRDGLPELKEVQHRIEQVKGALRSDWLHPNVLPYQAMVISQGSSTLVRQHFLRNLNDRLHTRPFLSMLEKKWLAFQVIAGVCQAHSSGVVHGDLKTENIFVASWNHAIITDFATFKPMMLPEDDPTEFSFFFESDRNRHRCYLAPERFECTGGKASIARGRFSRELAAMDIFSLGCVLAEVFLDGQTLLDLPQLRAFRRGELDLREKLSALSPELMELISPMLARDPAQRRSATSHLQDWCSRMVPRSFCSCFYPLLVLMLHPLYQQPDLRVALLRANLATIVWLLAGHRTIAGKLSVETDRPGTWQAWRSHVEQRVPDLDAVLPSIITSSLQAASSLEPEAVQPGASAPVEAGVPMQDVGLVQPLLEEASCLEFTTSVFEAWDAGFKACAASGQIEEGEAQDHALFLNLLTKLCSGQNHSRSSDPPGSGDEPGDSAEEALGILCGLIGSCAQHVLSPRCRLTCIGMMELLAPFASQDTLLEQIVPYSHVLMTDPVAKVRAKALQVLGGALSAVTQLPASHATLFGEYIFPQLTSMMTGMNNEPVVLLSVAKNIGVLATQSMRFAELAVASRPVVQASNTPKAEAPASSVQVEKFDVQVKHLQEALRKVVKALIDFVSIQGSSQEEALVAHTMSREVKIALLRNTAALADAFGREGTHNFLLPYLITFMNDPAWEVRAALLEGASVLPMRVGQVTTEGIIWPCYEEALQDQEERVVEVALQGLQVLVSQGALRRASLVTVTKKVAPLLVHPSLLLREHAAEVVGVLAAQLSDVDQYVFLLPAVQPYLVPHGGLGHVASSLVTSLGRRSFKSVVLRRADALHDALVSQQPLPATGDAAELATLELLRPYLQPLLSARASKAAGQRDDVAWHTLQVAKVQSIQYATVNPQAPSSRSLAARSEANTTNYHSWLPMMPKGVQHPLGLLSLQAYLVKAFCLPPKPCDLGTLSFLDGMPYSLYAPSPALTSTSVTVRHELAGLDQSGALLQDSIGSPKDGTGLSVGTSVSSVLVSASGAAEKSTSSTAPVFRGLWPRYESSVGAPDAEATGRLRMGVQQPTWRPKGQLLATLYEYAHQSGVPVVKVDATDDSRVLVTGGADGVVKIWSCAQLESDVAPSASCSVSLPSRDTTSKRQVLRALRTIRNSKAFAAGTNFGQVLLYKVETSRGGAKLVQAARYASPLGQSSAASVTCIEQFDSELDSMVVFTQDTGDVLGWDVRCSSAWSLQTVAPALGVPTSLALGNDGHSATVATLGGSLIVYDLRFLRPWKVWKVSTGAGVLSMRPADFASSPGVFAALGSKMNEVVLFDVTQGSCLTLFLTDPVGEKPKEEALSVPTLTEVPVVAGMPQVTWDDSSSILSGARFGTGSVRSLWLPQRGAPTFLLTAGSDRKVRHWSLDPSQTSQDCSIVTPPDMPGQTERPSYSANHLGDVFVVQERGGHSNEVPTALSRVGSQEASSPSPNHRDAILDLCTISLQHDILVTAGRDGLVKLWR